MSILASFTEDWLINDLSDELGIQLSDIKIASTQYIVEVANESNFNVRVNIPSFQDSATFLMNNLVSAQQSPAEKWMKLRSTFTDMNFETFCSYYRETSFAGLHFGLNNFDSLMTKYYNSYGYDEALDEAISRKLKMIGCNTSNEKINAIEAFDMATAAILSGAPFNDCERFKRMVSEARVSVLSSQQVSLFHEKAVFEPLKKRLCHQAILK